MKVKCVVPEASTLSCITLIAPDVTVYVCVGHGNTVPVTSKLSCVVAALAPTGSTDQGKDEETG